MAGFGDKGLEITKEWPSKDDLNQFSLNKVIRINSIGFKRSGKNEPLTGFSLGFTNDIKSPLYQTQNAKCHN